MDHIQTTFSPFHRSSIILQLSKNDHDGFLKLKRNVHNTWDHYFACSDDCVLVLKFKNTSLIFREREGERARAVSLHCTGMLFEIISGQVK